MAPSNIPNRQALYEHLTDPGHPRETGLRLGLLRIQPVDQSSRFPG